MTTFFARISILLVLPLAFFLTSCGGGSITVAGKAQLIGSRDYDGYVITNAVALPGHTFAYGQFTSDSLLFDCVSDSLTPKWHRALYLNSDEKWGPVLLSSKIGLVAVGPATWADKDTSGVQALVLDPATGAIVRQTILKSAATPDSKDRYGKFRVKISSDSTKLLIYRYDYHNAIGKDHDRTMTLTGYVYSSSLEQLGSGSMDIAVPDDEDDDDLKYDLYGAQVAFDNNGNFYEFSAFPKNRISVKRYDLSTRTTETLDTTFEKIDLKDLPEALSQAQPVFDQQGRLVLGMLRRIKKHRPDAFIVACFDFDKKTVPYTGILEPTKHQIDSLVDESDLDDFILSHVVSTTNPPMTIMISEEDESYHEKMQSTSWTVYKLTKAFIAGFDNTGHPAFQTGLKKVQETEMAYGSSTAEPIGMFSERIRALSGCLSFAVCPRPSKLGLLYYDGDQNGLFEQDLSLPSGALQPPQKILNVSGGCTLLTASTLWPDDGNPFLVFARGKTSSSVFHVKM